MISFLKGVPEARHVFKVTDRPRNSPPMHRHDFVVVFLFIMVGLSVIYTFSLYKVQEVSFPRHSHQFLPDDQLLDALIAAQEVLQINPDDLKALAGMAVARFQQSNRHFEVFCPPPENNPKHYQRQHHYIEGLQVLERARFLGSLDKRLFYYAGVMYEAEGLPEYSQDEYEKFLRNEPDDVEARLRLGNLLFKRERLTEAIEHFELAYALDPKNPLVNFNLGVAYSEKGRYTESMEVLERVIDGGQVLPPLGNYHLGRVYAAQKKYDEAMEYLLREILVSPNYLPLHEMLAETYEDLGDYSSAQAAWQRALEIKPGWKRAKKKILQLSKRATETKGKGQK